VNGNRDVVHDEIRNLDSQLTKRLIDITRFGCELVSFIYIVVTTVRDKLI
jgi:hypothetical protein